MDAQQYSYFTSMQTTEGATGNMAATEQEVEACSAPTEAHCILLSEIQLWR